MAPVLVDALRKRHRIWGAENAQVLQRMRAGKDEYRPWPRKHKRFINMSFAQFITVIRGAP